MFSSYDGQVLTAGLDQTMPFCFPSSFQSAEIYEGFLLHQHLLAATSRITAPGTVLRFQPQPVLQPPLRSCEDFRSVQLPRRVPCPLAMRSTPTYPCAMAEWKSRAILPPSLSEGITLSLAPCGRGSIDPDSATTALCRYGFVVYAIDTLDIWRL